MAWIFVVMSVKFNLFRMLYRRKLCSELIADLSNYWKRFFDIISADYILDIGLSVFVWSMYNTFGPTE